MLFRSFITLAATLSSVHTLPVAGLALLLGVDRFMSEARAITNLIGNGVATIVVARWEGALDQDRMQRVLSGESILTEDDFDAAFEPVKMDERATSPAWSTV